jgi:GTP pyrophosphokinase
MEQLCGQHGEGETMRLSGMYEEALIYAFRVHSAQVRKGSGVPYVSHVLAVSALALEHGADEEEAVAALLHDAVEDHGAALREEIQARFGARVLEIVDGCSDAAGHPKPPWQERKLRYVGRLASESPSVQLVSGCDKLHNLRSIIRDYRTIGEELWTRFNGGKEGTLWYYREVISALGRLPVALERELRAAWQEMEALAGAQQ